MGNSWFQFKQFRIEQDACAMKVTTDACLFGAWAARQLASLTGVRHVADAGTGTGLLSLMLAQQLPHITVSAIEIEASAASQARINIAASPWGQRITVFEDNLIHWNPPCAIDVLMSNPPFHENQLKSGRTNKDQAHHDDGLLLEELLDWSTRFVSAHGHLLLLLPAYRHSQALQLAGLRQWHLHSACLLHHSAAKPPIRSLLHWGRQPATHPPSTFSMALMEHPNYSPEAKDLLAPFYLKL